VSTRPLPDLEHPLYGPHWAAAAAERLEVQKCEGCGALRWPPGPTCPECLRVGGRWTPLSGAGRIWSVAIYEHAFDEAFRDELPYACVLVELAEGPSLIARAVGIEPEELEIGMCVEAVFPEVAPGIRLLGFAPVADPQSAT
jgi:uncharacterized OB-fold protein